MGILFFLDKIIKIFYFSLKNTMEQILGLKIWEKSEIKLFFLD